MLHFKLVMFLPLRGGGGSCVQVSDVAPLASDITPKESDVAPKARDCPLVGGGLSAPHARDVAP
jgi:hypothetical protein